MGYQHGSLLLDPDFAYLPPSIICFLLFILCFLVRRQTTKYSQKHHSFPALGFTAFVGGAVFLVFHIAAVRQGATAIVLAGLATLLVFLWIGARIIYPQPVKKPRKIKAHDRYDGQAKSKVPEPTIPLDEIDLFSFGEDDQVRE